MSLGGTSGPRVCARICKLAGRRQRMLLRLLVSVAVAFCFLFSSLVSKDEDASPGVETMLVFSDHVRSFVNPVWTSSGRPVDRKRTGPRPCPVCYLPVEQALALRPAKPSLSPVLQSLNYVLEEILIPKESKSGSLFGGFPSLEERDKSYDIKDSMTVHCGFVRGKVPGLNTGFDIDEADHSEMQLCQSTVVASAIFGNYDVMQQPENISKFSKDTVCFFMFLDEETEAAIKNTTIGHTKKIGLWRVVVVRNLPFTDARRNGKVPKLLLHRLFPNARYSIWIDGKLKLVRDPYQIIRIVSFLGLLLLFYYEYAPHGRERSRGQAWTHCQAAFGESKKSESAMSKLMTRSLLLEPSLLKNTPR
ncbi:hypothetical protein Zm00014a_027953 [Zea mays]|uniref:TOD1/MUCI70 glycosyltransferase-like domain-containing protein n=1 Tax=Zea mays TaxID=4577 RepID=A0A3L6DQH6_MAIZE|nr:hypothetical protein Zm00014a_027953 [Zea mays]